MGLGQIVESFSLAPDPTALRGPRAYGELIASRWPVEPLSPEAFKIPWRERVLSATVTTPTEPIEVHTTHIPPGVTNAWIKIDTLEGIFDRLACPVGGSQGPVRDFNTPQQECADGSVITWAQRRRPDGGWGLVSVAASGGTTFRGPGDGIERALAWVPSEEIAARCTPHRRGSVRMSA